MKINKKAFESLCKLGVADNMCHSGETDFTTADIEMKSYVWLFGYRYGVFRVKGIPKSVWECKMSKKGYLVVERWDKSATTAYQK